MSATAQAVETKDIVNPVDDENGEVTQEITKGKSNAPWKPGQSGNPAGRPLGARSKFSLAFYDDLLDVWTEHGKEAMVMTAKKDPATFVRVAASLMPKQVKAEITDMRTLVVELVGATLIPAGEEEPDYIEGELEDDD